MTPADPHLRAAHALIAAAKARGGVNGLGQLEAHGLVRQSAGAADTTPQSWQAARAALDAIAAGKGAEVVAAALGRPAGDAAGYPAHLYGVAAGGDKPSQWVSPARRRALLRRSSLGRAVLGSPGQSATGTSPTT
jgi:hypothetical protein